KKHGPAGSMLWWLYSFCFIFFFFNIRLDVFLVFFRCALDVGLHAALVWRDGKAEIFSLSIGIFIECDNHQYDDDTERQCRDDCGGLQGIEPGLPSGQEKRSEEHTSELQSRFDLV